MVELKVEKTADRSYIFLGISNKIKYSIIISNIGDTIAHCVKVRDIISEGAFFLKNSLSINGCKYDMCGIYNYFSIGSIKPGANVIISYDVEINKCNPPEEICNQAIVSYCIDNTTVEVASNKLVIPVINVDVNMCKTVDKQIACVGETLSYAILIRNNSNIKIDNAILYDKLIPELEIIPSSVKVNTENLYPLNIENGLTIGTINAFANVMVTFQVIIRSLPTMPLVTNSADIKFEYEVVDNGIAITSVGVACSNKVSTKILRETTNCQKEC